MGSSVYLENLGNMKFRMVNLPEACQVAPINDFLVRDFDADGQLDVLLAGNEYASEVQYGRFDAMTGILLKGQGGNFQVISSSQSGFYAPLHTSQLLAVEGPQPYVVVAQNNAPVKVFRYANH